MKVLIALAALAGLLGGLISGAPADKLIPRVVPEGANLQFYELSGTLLSGQAGVISTPRVQLDDVSWRLRPASLLTGRVAADVQTRVDGARLATHVSRSLGGTTRVRDLQASLPVQDLKTLLKLPFLPIEGQISAQIDTLDIEGQLPVQAGGVVRVGNTAWALSKPPAPLGEFQAVIETTDEGIVATISDREAAVELDGRAVLEPDGSYRFEAKLRPRPTAPVAVRNNIRAMGRPDAQGWQTLRYNGRLPGAKSEEQAGSS